MNGSKQRNPQLSKIIKHLDAREPWRPAWCRWASTVSGWTVTEDERGYFEVTTPDGARRRLSATRTTALMCQGWRAAARAELEEARRRSEEWRRGRYRREQAAKGRTVVSIDTERVRQVCANCGTPVGNKAQQNCGPCSDWRKRLDDFLTRHPTGEAPSLHVRWCRENPFVTPDWRHWIEELALRGRADAHAYGVTEDGKWLNGTPAAFQGGHAA